MLSIACEPHQERKMVEIDTQCLSSFRRYELQQRIEPATANFAMTVRPVYREEIYQPENKEVLNLLKQIFKNKGLHVTITATFADAHRTLYQVADNLIDMKGIIFYPKCIGNQRGTDEKTVQLHTDHDEYSHLLSRLRRSTLRGWEQAEIRMRHFFPVECSHIRFSDRQIAALVYQYVDYLVPVTVYLAERRDIIFELYFLK